MELTTERLIIRPWKELDAESLFGICKGPGGGTQGRLACAHKCGFRYQHTEKDKPCPLMGDVRTEHFYYLTKEEWQKEKERHQLIG